MAEDSTDVEVSTRKALPAPETKAPSRPSTPELSVRSSSNDQGTEIGFMICDVYDGKHCGYGHNTLIVNGGCVNFERATNLGVWKKGYRCRFFK
jgi:hypothetical protein